MNRRRNRSPYIAVNSGQGKKTARRRLDEHGLSVVEQQGIVGIGGAASLSGAFESGIASVA